MLCVVLCLCLLISGISFTNLTTKVIAGTGNDVTEKLTNIKVSLQDSNGNDVIIDNTVQPEATLVYKVNYTLLVSWDILQQEFEGKVKAGDFISLDISNNYFTYTNTSLDNQLIHDGVTIGTWGIQNNKIICTFSNNAETSLKASGYFTANGYLSSKLTGVKSINIAGVDVVIDVNPEQTGFPYAGENILYTTDFAIKYGTNMKGSDIIYWDIIANANNATQYYYTKMNTPESIHNKTFNQLLITDSLPDDLIVDDIAIQVPIYRPKDATTLSTAIGGKLDITNQFTKINQGSMSGSDWETALKSDGPAYGWSNDGKTVMVYIGDLPDHLILANDETGFRVALKDMNFGLTDDEVNALVNIYGENGSYLVRYIDVIVASKAESGVFEKDSYQNTAHMICPEFGDVPYESTELSIEQIEGGIQVVTPKSVKLTKKDYNTEEVISGAKFKLQYLDGSTWEDYKEYGVTVEKITDEYGQAEFSNLSPAVYRLVEVEAKTGYDITSAEYSVNQFEIKDSDTAGKSVTVTNKVLPMIISGTKTWNDNEDAAGKRPTTITVRLMNGSIEVDSKIVSAGQGWNYIFNNIPVYDTDNNKINYTIREDAVANYSTGITGYNITNTYVPETTEEPSTTEEPTTEEPSTTEEPTTEEPSTTEEPTTEEPSTTEEPTTEEPSTTEEPTTEEPSTTEEPTTEEPTTTVEPTTEAPTTPEQEIITEDGTTKSNPDTEDVSTFTEETTDEESSNRDTSEAATSKREEKTKEYDTTEAEGIYNETTTNKSSANGKDNQADSGTELNSSANDTKYSDAKVKTGDSLNRSIFLLSLSSAAVIAGIMINRKKHGEV